MMRVNVDVSVGRNRLQLLFVVVFVLGGSAAGCEASFVDQRERGDAFQAISDPGPDAGGKLDLLSTDDQLLGDGTVLQAGVIAGGTFEGRAGHAGKGSAELVRQADGRVVLRFGSDFAVDGVPGPVVVLSHRDALGTAIDAKAGDLHLGTLESTSGAQSYPLDGGDGGHRWAWVFCEPFAVEIARAKLEVTP